MFCGARSHFPSSKQHIHNLHISYLHIPMQKGGAYVNTKYTKATYLTASGPGGSAWCGCLIIGHMWGNLAYAHICTNTSAPPICFAVVSDALHKCLYSQLSAALPQLYFLPLLIGFKNCRYMTEIRSPDLSINNIPPNISNM